MTDSKVKQVARAIGEAQWKMTNDGPYPDDSPGTILMAEARGAILAMREPTKAMKLAGVLALSAALKRESDFLGSSEAQAKLVKGDYPLMPVVLLTARSSDESNAVWQAMHTAALEESDDE